MISSAGAAWRGGWCERSGWRTAQRWRAAGVLRSDGARGWASGWFDWLARAAAGQGLRAFVRLLYEQKCCTEVSNDLILLRRSQKSAKNRRGLVY